LSVYIFNKNNLLQNSDLFLNKPEKNPKVLRNTAEEAAVQEIIIGAKQ